MDRATRANDRHFESLANDEIAFRRYELIRFPPDSPFDPLRMEKDGGSVDILAGEGQRVKHCSHAAIQALSTEPVKDGDAVEKATVQP
ncbi:hypothetical protein HYALB_00006787 [Hymenoscyphus albidus]|uniref:Uncharacterized protein n=1 Tax=Hymenoscyphus albidus TaxID=595503 RepID=A0A9N9QDR5_9HELO|nr:hypothetical protein HYALB_00006787 [Hymenoscyphus albidus]